MTQEKMKELKKERLSNYLDPSEMAYRDLCRTIRLQKGKQKPKDDDTLYKFRKVIVGGIDKALTALRNIKSKEAFDKWHEDVCDLIIGVSVGERQNASNPCEEYTALYKPFTYGQAQKWVNMTLKNAYLLTDDIDEVYNFLHCPVDSIIIAAVKVINKELKAHQKETIEIPSDSWSTWTDYNKYIKFQNRLREVLSVHPLDFDFKVWPKYKEGDSLSKEDKKEHFERLNNMIIELMNRD